MTISPLAARIESILFVAGKPITYKRLADLLDGAPASDIAAAITQLQQAYEESGHGLCIVSDGRQVQLATRGEHADAVKKIVKEELTGELTKPSVETLAIIAYRGPISKLELERIRGINCSLIVRNLLLRGLIEAQEDKKKGETYYTVTLDFIRHLGLTDIGQLPEYERLRHNEDIEKFLAGEV